MSIGQKIILLRKEKGINGLQCCNEIGITRSTLQNIENERSKPGSDLIIKICNYFKVSADWLLGLKKERN